MTKKSVFIFFIIIFIAAFLRLYRITEIPPGINRDEGSIGYTAYSLLKTGKDEYGRMFPVSFESFGDWKLPFYIYTVVPFVLLFGLSELAVRFPSALFGTATVGLSYFLIVELFKSRKIALLTSLLVAISPWHLHLSRVESESNTAVFFVVLGVLFFLKSIKTSWLIVPSMICFAITYFTYAGNHVFTTLLVIGIAIIYRSSIKINKWVVIGGIIFVFLSGFIFYHTFFEANKTKLSGIGIFGDPSVVHAKIEIPRNEHDNPNSLFTRLVHNRIVFGLERFGQNYLNSFSPQFLFIKGGENRAHNIVNFGNMYLIEAPFLVLGLVFLIITKKTKEIKLVLLWFFIAPIAASITKDAPHTNRMFAIFPMLSLVTALGLTKFIDMLNTWFKNKLLYKNSVLLIIFALFIINMLVYMDRYFVHFPHNEAQSWGIGYKALVDVIFQEKYASKEVIMSHPEYSHYIFLLFYNKYDPLKLSLIHI